ncbi:putative ubiquitin specific protease, papain-like cysteine peptidase superfamily [Septoria linicola]|nr:putative ubiquitin specific protease, papain-like cysteine peptidase superfamily [Septoria linicola]
MPDKPLTIATYAAGASLAAITLVYVFGPTFFLDSEDASSTKSSRKKGVVGLVNPANDCFINSVLQALAGLPDLRAFLIREVHRRKLDGPAVYEELTAALEEQAKKRDGAKRMPEWQIVGLQQGLVTAGLKDVLDALNERPIYKKTISAQGFIRCVETSFRTRISRTQQDAQEFLQVIVERIAEEYYAGRRARKGLSSNEEENSRVTIEPPSVGSDGAEPGSPDQAERPRDSKVIDLGAGHAENNLPARESEIDSQEDENVFPLEGELESQVECSHCHFKPKPSVSTFLTLTLNVPHQQTSTTLNECFDGIFKVEHIDDFKCEYCRLVHAISINERILSRSNLFTDDRSKVESENTKLQQALDEDPEAPPKDVKLPDVATAPTRRISRHTRMSKFPKVLSIHLSRSVWDPSASSSKNMAKVAFPESLPLGGLLDRKHYRLLGVVTHKGGHNSGHYESFRRQVLPQPFSTPTTLGRQGVYSIAGSPAPSTVNSPRLSASAVKDARDSTASSADSQFLSTPTSAAPSSSSASSISNVPASTPSAEKRKSANSVPFDAIPTPGLPTPPSTAAPAQAATAVDALKSEEGSAPRRTSSLRNIRGAVSRKSKKNSGSDRWWRISDEKVKESKTSDVLSMQKEVYMLFYEMIPEA